MTVDEREAAREAGRAWAREHPLTEQHKQRIWSLLNEQQMGEAS